MARHWSRTMIFPQQIRDGTFIGHHLCRGGSFLSSRERDELAGGRDSLGVSHLGWTSKEILSSNGVHVTLV